MIGKIRFKHKFALRITNTPSQYKDFLYIAVAVNPEENSIALILIVILILITVYKD